MKTAKMTPRATRTLRQTAYALAASGEADNLDLKAIALLLPQCANRRSEARTTAKNFQLKMAKLCLARQNELPESGMSRNEWFENAPIEEIERVLFGPRPEELLPPAPNPKSQI